MSYVGILKENLYLYYMADQVEVVHLICVNSLILKNFMLYCMIKEVQENQNHMQK